MDLYNSWAAHNAHVHQLSFQRSGRVWISTVFARFIGQGTVYSIDDAQGTYDEFYGNMPGYPFCASHGTVKMMYYPHNKYVLLLRDPRDSFLSWLRFHDRTNAIVDSEEDEIERWCKIIEQRYFHSALFKQALFVLPYEQMCLQPEMILNALLEFTGYEPKITFANLNIDGEMRHISPFDRYAHHCLKWQHQHDNRFPYDLCKYVWKRLEQYYEQFGYRADCNPKDIKWRAV